MGKSVQSLNLHEFKERGGLWALIHLHHGVMARVTLRNRSVISRTNTHKPTATEFKLDRFLASQEKKKILFTSGSLSACFLNAQSFVQGCNHQRLTFPTDSPCNSSHLRLTCFAVLRNALSLSDRVDRDHSHGVDRVGLEVLQHGAVGAARHLGLMEQIQEVCQAKEP